MSISLQKISVSYPGWAMRNLSLEFPQGSFTSILGPSGCGKTTLLRLIAGLEAPESGSILFSGKDVTAEPAEKRGVGFAFQADALFSHLNVLGNVAFGLEVRGEKNVEQKAKHALEAAGLSGFEGRGIEKLSGGEKKRVAIARAIAYSPKVLLLDEPFNGLDGNLRSRMKGMLKGMQKSMGLTVIMATHDLNDALRLSDKIIVMAKGSVEQEGVPKEIISKPKNSFVRDFISDVRPRK